MRVLKKCLLEHFCLTFNKQQVVFASFSVQSYDRTTFIQHCLAAYLEIFGYVSRVRHENMMYDIFIQWYDDVLTQNTITIFMIQIFSDTLFQFAYLFNHLLENTLYATLFHLEDQLSMRLQISCSFQIEARKEEMNQTNSETSNIYLHILCPLHFSLKI